MPSYPIPKDLVAEYSAACQIVSQYEELRALGPVDPDKAAWAGQELETKTLIERIAILESAVSDEEDGWIRTNERMPDTRGEIGHSLAVLIYKPHNACCFLAVWAGFYGWQDWTNQLPHAEKEVSHWRSLPESPEGIGGPDGLYKFEED
jgi:hypothetical protein